MCGAFALVRRLSNRSALQDQGLESARAQAESERSQGSDDDRPVGQMIDGGVVEFHCLPDHPRSGHEAEQHSRDSDDEHVILQLCLTVGVYVNNSTK